MNFMKSNRLPLMDLSVWAMLVALGVAARIEFRELPNFKPVAALGMFAGYYFAVRRCGTGQPDTTGLWLSARSGRTAAALAVPFLVMGLSDLILGGYDPRLMAVVYLMLAAPVFAGPFLRRAFSHRSGDRFRLGSAFAGLLVCSLAGSFAFFLVTNFACWILSTHYDRSLSGLARCYVNALPFFRYTLGGDLFFACATFGTHAAWMQWRSRSTAGTDSPTNRAAVLSAME
ncbi:MAG: hypothetical protein FJ295_08345 [Planctomycetes bacterium]|nr:hypothetical protein [Planctomycetota bacterium]